MPLTAAHEYRREPELVGVIDGVLTVVPLLPVADADLSNVDVPPVTVNSSAQPSPSEVVVQLTVSVLVALDGALAR